MQPKYRRKTLHDRIRSEDLRQQSEIQDIGRWVRQRRKYWNEHVNRMEDNRLVKIAKTNNLVGNRTQGRSPQTTGMSAGRGIIRQNRH